MTAPTQELGLNVRLEGDMESVQARVAEALKSVGFGILTEIDVQTTLKNKIDVDFRPYKILGACNPKLAHRALTATEGEIGLLLPCNVTLSQDTEGEVLVSFVNPIAMLSVVPNDDLQPIAQEAYDKLSQALNAL